MRLRRGTGRWCRPNPPCPPNRLTLPRWLLNTLGPGRDPLVCTGPAEGCAGDQPLFAGGTHAHMPLECVFHRLVCCHIRRHGEGKGTCRRDTERAGTWTLRPLLGEPMSPVPKAIGVGSPSSLNLCGDPRGVRFGTAHFIVALQYLVTLGWCRPWRQGKRVDFTVQWTAVLVGVRPVYDHAVRHQ